MKTTEVVNGAEKAASEARTGRRVRATSHKSKKQEEPEANPTQAPTDNQQEHQSAAIKQLQEAIRSTHAIAKKSSLDILLAGAKCGLLLLLGKSVVDHGQFEAWVEKGNFGISRMTRSNYMRFAEHLIGLGKSKTILLLKVELDRDKRLVSFAFDEEALKSLVSDVSKGRSITDLYMQWGITKSQPGQKANNPNSKSGAAAFKRFLVGLDALPHIFPSLPNDEKTAVIAKLEAALNAIKKINTHEEVQ